MSANRRWSRADFSSLIWGLVDAFLVMLLLHCAYSVLQFGIHRNELGFLEGNIQSGSDHQIKLRRRVHLLILDTFDYAKRDPEVLSALSRHGIDPATFPRQVP